MSEIDYSGMTTDELLTQFAEKTHRLGGYLTWPPKIPYKSTEREILTREIKAIGEEIRARNPIQKLRKLFEDESRDVRAWAATQFGLTDPEWASAASSGVCENIPTREVVALRKRALKKPPARPALTEMSDDQLIERFEDAGIRDYATRFLAPEFSPRDIELSNRIVHEIIGIGKELKSRDAVEKLMPLLNHENITVRRHAADECLPINPERAIAVLEAIAASRDPNDYAAAAGTLDHWRQGKHHTIRL